MKKDTEQIKVIFRKFKDGDVIAFFPEIKGWDGSMESYMHLGQHSSADYNGLLSDTKPATPEEYKDLATELESIGYNLLIRKRRCR